MFHTLYNVISALVLTISTRSTASYYIIECVFIMLVVYRAPFIAIYFYCDIIPTVIFYFNINFFITDYFVTAISYSCFIYVYFIYIIFSHAFKFILNLYCLMSVSVGFLFKFIFYIFCSLSFKYLVLLFL